MLSFSIVVPAHWKAERAVWSETAHRKYLLIKYVWVILIRFDCFPLSFFSLFSNRFDIVAENIVDKWPHFTLKYSKMLGY